MQNITMAELRLKQATLKERAERLRAKQRGIVATSPGALALAREIIITQQRADDYERIITMVGIANSLDDEA